MSDIEVRVGALGKWGDGKWKSFSTFADSEKVVCFKKVLGLMSIVTKLRLLQKVGGCVHQLFPRIFHLRMYDGQIGF